MCVGGCPELEVTTALPLLLPLSRNEPTEISGARSITPEWMRTASLADGVHAAVILPPFLN